MGLENLPLRTESENQAEGIIGLDIRYPRLEAFLDRLDRWMVISCIADPMREPLIAKVIGVMRPYLIPREKGDYTFNSKFLH